MAGSLVYRSVQFGAYTFTHAFLAPYATFRTKLPSSDIETRVIVGGLASGFCRATVETPLEYFKVMRQTGGQPMLNQAFRGYSVTLARSCGLMTTFFILLDVAGRQIPDIAGGAFFRGGVCATVSWWVVWPLEVSKSQIQSGLPGPNRIIVIRCNLLYFCILYDNNTLSIL